VPLTRLPRLAARLQPRFTTTADDRARTPGLVQRRRQRTGARGAPPRGGGRRAAPGAPLRQRHSSTAGGRLHHRRAPPASFPLRRDPALTPVRWCRWGRVHAPNGAAPVVLPWAAAEW